MLVTELGRLFVSEMMIAAGRSLSGLGERVGRRARTRGGDLGEPTEPDDLVNDDAREMIARAQTPIPPPPEVPREFRPNVRVVR